MSEQADEYAETLPYVDGATSRRMAALDMSLRFNVQLTRDAKTIVDDAKVFEAFLKGDTK